MRCAVAREALSARIDGERETVPSARVDEHVAGCVDCTQWYEALKSLHIPEIREPMRVVRADTGPDLVKMMIAAGDPGPVAGRNADSDSRTWWLVASVGAFVSGALAVAAVATRGSVLLICLFAVALLATIGLTWRARR